MRTTSGARVFKVGGRAVKVGFGDVGKRVQAQASYCRQLGPAVCPRIDIVFPRGYVMETLQPYELRESPESYIRDVTERLRTHVWSQPSDRPVRWATHLDYVMSRAQNLPEDIVRDIAMIWNSLGLKTRGLQACLTHGDPTFDNMMMRYDAPVVIDPLPPYENGEMPELAAVDVGKIMQSLLGYETIKYGQCPWTAPMWAEARFAMLHFYLGSHRLPHDEWKAAHWFLITHIVRLIPYQPEEKHSACIELLRRALELTSNL